MTVNETKNNLVDRNIELIKTSKKMNRCILIFIVSIFEFIFKSTNSILSIHYNKLQYGEYMWLISIIILSRIFFFSLFAQNGII